MPGFPDVFPIERADVERARDILLGVGGGLSARDALHVAIMQARGVSRIMSFDEGFHRFTWMERLSG